MLLQSNFVFFRIALFLMAYLGIYASMAIGSFAFIPFYLLVAIYIFASLLVLIAAFAWVVLKQKPDIKTDKPPIWILTVLVDFVCWLTFIKIFEFNGLAFEATLSTFMIFFAATNTLMGFFVQLGSFQQK